MPTVPLLACVTRVDLGVHPDHLAVQVEQRAPRVAVVDGGVGLDDVVDGVLVGRDDLPLERADDARRRRAHQPEGVADGDHLVADLHRVGVAERERGQCTGTGAHPQHGEVGRRVGADDPRLHALVVREADQDRLGAGDHVVVRDDVAGLVHDEARTERLLGLHRRAEGGEEGIRRRHDLAGGGDLDDTGGRVPVDLPDRLLAARAERIADGRRHGDVHVADLGRLGLAEPDPECDAEGEAGSDCACSDQRSRAGKDLSLSHLGGIALARSKAVAWRLRVVGSVLSAAAASGPRASLERQMGLHLEMTVRHFSMQTTLHRLDLCLDHLRISPPSSILHEPMSWNSIDNHVLPTKAAFAVLRMPCRQTPIHGPVSGDVSALAGGLCARFLAA